MKKVVLITGGSRGLGSKFVERLSTKGDYKTYFTYNNSYEQATKIQSIYNDVVAIKCDQKDENQIADCVSKVFSVEGKIDVLVNNACPPFRPCDLLDSNWQMFSDLLDVNLKGSYYFTRECGKIMKNQKSGKIINILTSMLLNVPPKKLSFYITAKYALLGLSKSSAAELAEHGITVNMISPGMMETDLSSFLPEKFFEAFIYKHPMKKITTVDDVANVLEFLVSENTCMLNGVNIPVNGGELYSC